MSSEEYKIVYDARVDIAAGIHPVEKVMAALETLRGDERYLPITPFSPIPLAAKARDKGFKAEEKVVNSGEFHTVFYK